MQREAERHALVSAYNRGREPQSSPGILSFSETSDPSEESQGLTGLNGDPFFFVLKCVFI